MAKQLFVNNFEWTLASAVKGTPSSGSPETELDYGVIRLAPAAEAFLPAPGGGDWYLMTLLARSGSVESGIEIVKVLGANEPAYAMGGEFRLRVLRGQEGTNPVPHAAGDLAAVRFTAAGAAHMVQDTDDRLSDARPPTGFAGGVLAGNYPNPAFAEPMATSADLSAAVGTREAAIWFKEHQGALYNWQGIFGFLAWVIPGKRGRYACHEACAAALGHPSPSRTDPAALCETVLWRLP